MSNLSAGDSPIAGPSIDRSDNFCESKNHLNRLLEKQLDEIESASAKIEAYKNYKQDYEDLKKLTNRLQEKVRYPYRVPIAGTKLAFVDGHLIHTNELHVLLGDNYFSLRSAKQASMIIDRRLKSLDAQLKMSEDAKKRAEDWLNATREHKRDKEEFVEIIETM